MPSFQHTESKVTLMESVKKIAIIGAGFSGASVAAMLGRIARQPLEIILFDKSGKFGAGDAYRTPYPWHILNVRTRDMSAFEDLPTHFADWVNARQTQYAEIDKTQPISEQFLPRYIYHHYLQDLLQQAQSNGHIKLTFLADEVIDAKRQADKINVITKNNKQLLADKLVLALGNHQPMQFPFAMSGVQTIANPWDYAAMEEIPANANILIVGMGLTMIDAVLTLQQRHHQGKIYAVSRHGILPLPHADSSVSYHADIATIDQSLRDLTKQFREKCDSYTEQGGDWRSVINALRHQVPDLWQNATVKDKKRFIRHVLPYWNVHRHRVHSQLKQMLDNLAQQNKLQTFAARVLKIEQGQVEIGLRHQQKTQQFKADWVLNCMGPCTDMRYAASPLIKSLINHGEVSLDPLALGFATTKSGEIYDAQGMLSNHYFTLGPPAKGTVWECTAVPEIRRQSYALANRLVGG